MYLRISNDIFNFLNIRNVFAILHQFTSVVSIHNTLHSKNNFQSYRKFAGMWAHGKVQIIAASFVSFQDEGDVKVDVSNGAASASRRSGGCSGFSDWYDHKKAFVLFTVLCLFSADNCKRKLVILMGYFVGQLLCINCQILSEILRRRFFFLFLFLWSMAFIDADGVIPNTTLILWGSLDDKEQTLWHI